MDCQDHFTFIQVLLIAAIPSALTGFVAWIAARMDYRKHLREYKLDDAIERTIKIYLQNKKWRKRSFEILQRRMNGIDETNLRTHLIKAGAVSFMIKGGVEFWGLVERNREDDD